MKKNIIFTYIFILIVMSSCGVYSLFPIYTKDTLVEKKELIGKWVSSDDENNYIRFAKISYSVGKSKKIDSSSDSDKNNLKITFSGDEAGNVIDTEHYVIENGDTIIFKDTLLVQFEELIGKKVKQVETYIDRTKTDTYYTMRYYEKGEEIASFNTHVVKIGDQFFLDLFPTGSLSDDNLSSDNYFPVHTFLKIKFNDNKIELLTFDQSKLKDLFKSNLIRLRHELVEDRVLITAQPKEIQKFLDKYARKDGVYDDTSTYLKVPS